LKITYYGRGRTASFLVVNATLTVKGADGGALLDAPNFGGGWSKKISGRIFYNDL
jgi:hypothetical protein